MDMYILDADHQVRLVSWEEWIVFNKLPFDKTKRVAKDVIRDNEISTVFLGIDHNWNVQGPVMERIPVLFETMIFGGPYDKHQWRWHTWDEAMAGHISIVQVLCAGRVVDHEG